MIGAGLILWFAPTDVSVVKNPHYLIILALLTEVAKVVFTYEAATLITLAIVSHREPKVKQNEFVMDGLNA